MNRTVWDTSLMRRINALDAIYTRVERAQATFRESAQNHGSPLACPKRCGTCCVHFVPDLMPIEADRIAYYLRTEKGGLIDHFLAHRQEAKAADATCPFWNPDKPGENCMIYPARPLICRLFGFCSMLDKGGEPAFTLCRQMPPLPGNEKRRFIGTKTMDEVFGSIPPLMLDFSRAVIALDPSDSGGRTTIDAARVPSLSKVSLFLKFAAADSVDLEDSAGVKGAMVETPEDEPTEEAS